MNIDYQQLLDKAKEFTKLGIEWHHHYLSPNCMLNKSSKHLIILEAKGNKWQSYFKKKPLDKLEQLENIFFKRTK